MAYRLQVTESSMGISCNVRYQNLAKNKKPAVVAKAPTGKEVKEKTVYQGNILPAGSTQRRWVDDDGTFYGKSELTFFYNEEEVSENEQTKVFEIEGFQPVTNYTDMYVISAYYEMYPDDNGMKKDFDRDRAKQANLAQMYRLWKHLDDNNLVARGEFCTSSRGFVASDGYIRAISIAGKWGLEIGVFKEEKVFTTLHEGEPTAVAMPTSKPKGKKIKMV